MYFSEGQLRGFANNQPLFESANRSLNKSLASASTTIFLSHSHKDKELAKGLKNYLGSLGLNLYIDWEDTDMPGTPNRETAHALKRRISSTHYFLMLCTDNALQSRWVPWEVGIADMQKAAGRILIAPVINNSGQFNGNEYLQLYRKIDVNTAGAAEVFDPDRPYTGTPLKDLFLRHL
jgi:hypothetical protein